MMNLFTVLGLRGKEKPEPLWFEKYTSSCLLNGCDKIFLSYYTEKDFSAILGDEYFINSRYKIYLNEWLLGTYHFINTGKKVYFYTHGQDKQDLRKQNEALRSLVSELLKEK